MSAVKPLVPTGIATEYGVVLDDPETLFNEQGMNTDFTYVPGFSDMRRERDRAIAEGRTPQPLPVNLRWVRRTDVSGKPNMKRLFATKRQGYELVPASQIGKVPWLTDLPPGAVKLADGSIGNADMVLAVCAQERAARNAAASKLRWLQRGTDSLGDALKLAGDRLPTKGTNPETTTELGPAQQ